MSTITESQLLAIASPWSVNRKTEYPYNGFKIVVEQAGQYYDFEILQQDSFKGKWHVWHTDTDFETEEQAVREAKRYISDFEPNDDYYAQ